MTEAEIREKHRKEAEARDKEIAEYEANFKWGSLVEHYLRETFNSKNGHTSLYKLLNGPEECPDTCPYRHTKDCLGLYTSKHPANSGKMGSCCYPRNSKLLESYEYDDYDFTKQLIPEKVDEQAFKDLQNIKENVLKFVSNGMNLYLWSNNVGNGKTTWANKILNYAYYKMCNDEVSEDVIDKVKNHKDEAYTDMIVPQRHRKDFLTYFENVSEYLVSLKKSFNDKELAKAMERVDAEILTANLVVLDDIGVKAASDYDREILYYLINERLENGLSTIYTSNVSPEALSDILGARLQSRIAKSSVCIELKGSDRREFTVPTSLDFSKLIVKENYFNHALEISKGPKPIEI